ncbi:hypothetical protein [Cupriavidus basilensis]|uniref:Uncharacterized protein n=1 Tax=Cupriavidus basilensis TaxID=68895 RepID=A0A7M2GQ35_9BURK|nr:hypothetical protein [Cupriavidus basilensis]QOT74884.1 hypothetical protein F7R26_011505 [Cupriavidus basilensis]
MPSQIARKRRRGLGKKFIEPEKTCQQAVRGGLDLMGGGKHNRHHVFARWRQTLAPRDARGRSDAFAGELCSERGLSSAQ